MSLRFISLCCAVIVAVGTGLSYAQNNKDDVQKVDNAVKKSKQQTNPLRVESNIPDTARVHALLMPPDVVKNIFGKAISREYAVVEVDIFNLSKDSSLMVGDISVDYSEWIFANCPDPDPDDKEKDAQKSSKKSKQRKPEVVGTAILSKPCEVSSQEVRAVRQLALAGQKGSWRNRTDRLLHGFGIAGNALGVANLGKALAPTMSAFTNGLIPAFEFAFPDDTIDQINLLSDLAYRVNTVVPQESPRVVMAFFPVSRFLGSYFRSYYLKEPALFFSPLQYYLDPKFKPFFESVERQTQSFYQAKARADLLLALNSKNVPAMLRFSLNDLLEEMNSDDQDRAKHARGKLAVLVQAAQLAGGNAGLSMLPAIIQQKAYRLVTDLATAKDEEQGKAENALLNFAMELHFVGAFARDPMFEQIFPKDKDLDSKTCASKLEILKGTLKEKAPILTSLIPPPGADEEIFCQQMVAFLKNQSSTLQEPVEIDSDSSLDITNTNFTLNAVKIKIDGKFVTPVDNIPAQIDAVNFDLTKDASMNVFSVPGKVTGFMEGHYLDGGKPQVQAPKGLENIFEIAAVADGSTAEKLQFNLTWSRGVPSGVNLEFTVVKTTTAQAKTQNTTSNSLTKQIEYASPQATVRSSDSGDSIVVTTFTIDPKDLQDDNAFEISHSPAQPNDPQKVPAKSIKVEGKDSLRAPLSPNLAKGEYTLVVNPRFGSKATAKFTVPPPADTAKPVDSTKPTDAPKTTDTPKPTDNIKPKDKVNSKDKTNKK